MRGNTVWSSRESQHHLLRSHRGSYSCPPSQSPDRSFCTEVASEEWTHGPNAAAGEQDELIAAVGSFPPAFGSYSLSDRGTIWRLMTVSKCVQAAICQQRVVCELQGCCCAVCLQRTLTLYEWLYSPVLLWTRTSQTFNVPGECLSVRMTWKWFLLWITYKWLNVTALITELFFLTWD